MKSTLLLAAGSVAAHLAGERDFSEYSFGNYMIEFGKTYAKGELAAREVAFNENMKFIQQQNSKPNKSWFATVNKFTDLTNEEFRQQYHGHRPAPVDSFLRAKEIIIPNLPDSVDWRTNGTVLSPVKDQGQCGSCWAFSVVETLESRLAIVTGEKSEILSPQQLVSCAPNPDKCGGTGGCSGSIQTLGFNYTMTAGITTEASYPYKATTGICSAKKITPVAYNGGFVHLTPNDYTQLVTAIAQGPTAISVAAGTMGWQTYGGGVFDDTGCGYDQDHAVQAVGYGVEGAKMYWIVRNSWASSWGEGGFIRIERFGDGKEPCGVDKTPQDGEACAGDTTPRTYCGLCGLMGSSSYPTDMRKA